MSLFKKIFNNNKRLPIAWIDMDYSTGIPQYYAHIHPALCDDPELEKRFRAVTNYIKEEYEVEDFI